MATPEMSSEDQLRWEMNHWRDRSATSAVALWTTVARDSLSPNANESSSRYKSDWLARHSCEIFWAWGLAAPRQASAFALSIFGAATQGHQVSDDSNPGSDFSCQLMACYAGWAELGARGANEGICAAYGVEHLVCEVLGRRLPLGHDKPRLRLARKALLIGEPAWSSPRNEALDDWARECLSDLSYNVREVDLRELALGARFEAMSFISWCIDDAKPHWTSLVEGFRPEISQLGCLVDHAQSILDAAEIASAMPESPAPRTRRLAI